MKSEVNAVFLFIAELTGSFVPGSGTEQDKIAYGQQDYIHNYFPELNLEDEEDRKELHEVVWLERLYDELDSYFKISDDVGNLAMIRALSVQTTVNYRNETYRWTVPIECDASALTKCY